MTFYLYPPTADILDRLLEETGETQTSLMNAAIVFYVKRGAYMEGLIKKCVREALSEIKPTATRRSVLVRRVKLCIQ